MGLSNFSAWETVMACQICERNGWKRPTMYQGMYNALTKRRELNSRPGVCARAACVSSRIIRSPVDY